MRYFKRSNPLGGFTLIELLVVVAIIGILAAIALPQFAQYKKRANDAAAESDLRNSITAQEAYYIDNGEYKDCVSAFDCELTLPGFSPSKDTTGAYVILPFRHFAGVGGQTYTATATHWGGTTTYNYDSAVGAMTHLP